MPGKTHSELTRWTHGHEFAAVDSANERRTAAVVGLTAVMMVVEVAAGFLYGSMALLADGWHMATHVAALGISVFAYRYARRHAKDPRFTFGTGKVGVLGGFASAVALGVVALLMVAESAQRLVTRPAIRFDEAIAVALMGLAVNLASAVILGSGHLRHHRHDHDATCGHAGGNDRGRKPAREAPTPDHNLRAAYLHVLADALTSVSAVVALTFGKFFGQTWLDPVMGIVGSALIARWSYGLLRDTGHILIDAHVRENLLPLIRSTIESVDDNRIADLHVWKVGPDSYAAIVCVVTDYPRPPDYYRGLLANIDGLSHVSVEVQRCCQAPWFPHAPGPESRKGSK